MQRSIVLPALPEALDGLRIAHLSDLHVGELLTPDAIPGIVEAVNALDADLIALTGDLVDLSLGVLDEVLPALARLHAPLGVHLVPGNHDYLDDGPRFLHRCRDAGLHMMVNQSLLLPHRDCHIVLSGIDYAHRPQQLARMVHRTLLRAPKANGQTLRILLAHHPHAFDPACRHGIDLTLSGHTHGGQLILANNTPGRGSIGLASFAFKYPRGLYRRGNSYLYVTTGVGAWFPLRLRCPAEIALLTLRNQPDPLTPAEPSHP